MHSSTELASIQFHIDMKLMNTHQFVSVLLCVCESKMLVSFMNNATLWPIYRHFAVFNSGCLFSFGYKWKMIGSFSLIPMFITNELYACTLGLAAKLWLSPLRFVYLFSSVIYFLLRSYIFNQTGYFVHCKLYGNHFDQNNEWFESWIRWMRRVNEKTHTYTTYTKLDSMLTKWHSRLLTRLVNLHTLRIKNRNLFGIFAFALVIMLWEQTKAFEYKWRPFSLYAVRTSVSKIIPC